MAALFSQILNMSMTGSVVILLVLLARLILKRAPKIFSYALWFVVLFRLLCPVAFTAPVSVLNALKPEVQEASEVTSVVYFLPAEVNQNQEFTFVPAENQSGTELLQAGESEHTRFDLMTVTSYVWITGTGIMILYSVIQYIRLRGKLMGAMAYRGNVYRADYIDTPFVMGIFSPKIYLPSDVPMNERKYIIAHERHHIRRFDHVIKLLAYFALCIHWFNPLVWAAFIFAGKDMEMSCDEAVIRKMGSQIRADYSASLLRLATNKKIIAGMPLAFGEGDTKGRVMNMAKWKKPRLWVSLICLLLCTTILVACAVNPQTAGSTESTTTGKVSTSNGLNIRQEPSTTGAVVGNYDDGTIITILEIKDGWGRTDQGWVSLNYVTTMDGTSMVDIGQMETPVNGSTPADIENEYKELNIREKPDKSSAVVGAYPNGTIIAILETQDDWGKTDQGWIHMDYVTTVDGNTVVDTSDFQPAVDGSVIITDTELVQYGTLKMLLPSGYAAVNEDNAVVLTKDSVAVGGITCWSHPGFEPDDMIEWMRALGIPELQENYQVPIGYMAGGSSYGNYEIEIFWDGNPEALNEEHIFFIDGSIVYDVWYDQNRITDGKMEKLLKTISLNGELLTPVNPEEAPSLDQVRTVLSSIQSGSYQIVIDRKNEGNHALNKSSETVHSAQGEHWVSITHIPDDDSYHAYLYANGNYYSNEGSGWEPDGTVRWEVDPYPDKVYTPWIASFQWNEELVSYIDTFTENGRKIIMLRIEEPLWGYEDLTECYFVNVIFTEDGSFLNAEIQIDFFWENSISSVEITESIVTLDEAEVEDYITQEYNRAVSKS